jgi:chromosome segregation ATPase
MTNNSQTTTVDAQVSERIIGLTNNIASLNQIIAEKENTIGRLEAQLESAIEQTVRPSDSVLIVDRYSNNRVIGYSNIALATDEVTTLTISKLKSEIEDLKSKIKDKNSAMEDMERAQDKQLEKVEERAEKKNVELSKKISDLTRNNEVAKEDFKWSLERAGVEFTKKEQELRSEIQELRNKLDDKSKEDAINKTIAELSKKAEESKKALEALAPKNWIARLIYFITRKPVSVDTFRGFDLRSFSSNFDWEWNENGQKQYVHRAFFWGAIKA